MCNPCCPRVTFLVRRQITWSGYFQRGRLRIVDNMFIPLHCIDKHPLLPSLAACFSPLPVPHIQSWLSHPKQPPTPSSRSSSERKPTRFVSTAARRTRHGPVYRLASTCVWIVRRTIGTWGCILVLCGVRILIVSRPPGTCGSPVLFGLCMR